MVVLDKTWAKVARWAVTLGNILGGAVFSAGVDLSDELRYPKIVAAVFVGLLLPLLLRTGRVSSLRYYWKLGIVSVCVAAVALASFLVVRSDWTCTCKCGTKRFLAGYAVKKREASQFDKCSSLESGAIEKIEEIYEKKSVFICEMAFAASVIIGINALAVCAMSAIYFFNGRVVKRPTKRRSGPHP